MVSPSATHPNIDGVQRCLTFLIGWQLMLHDSRAANYLQVPSFLWLFKILLTAIIPMVEVIVICTWLDYITSCHLQLRFLQQQKKLSFLPKWNPSKINFIITVVNGSFRSCLIVKSAKAPFGCIVSARDSFKFVLNQSSKIFSRKVHFCGATPIFKICGKLMVTVIATRLQLLVDKTPRICSIVHWIL